MQIRRVYENVLIELNKVQAPALLLDDFVYLFNKCIQQYFNKRYNLFEVNQQLTDDLRVLTKSTELTPSLTRSNGDYKCSLPEDYVHILNCLCVFKPSDYDQCDKKTQIKVGAHKLDTNKWPSVISNYYMRPSVRQPYYYIMNIDEPTEIFKPTKDVDKQTGTRYGNYKQPVMEIKVGNDSRYELEHVYIDYLRAPEYVSLSVDDLDSVEDETQQLEFPDYVIYEIIKEIVTTCLENAKDNRLQTFIATNQTVPQK